MTNILKSTMKRYEIAEINAMADRDFNTLINLSEERFNKYLHILRDDIVKMGDIKKLIFLAGPSSSGKTTTAHKIKDIFDKVYPKNCIISMDDFYIDRDLAPIRPDGSQNLEGPESIDIKAMENSLKDLINSGSAQIPVFDFTTGKPSDTVKDVELCHNGVIIVEGLNALNPKVTDPFENMAEVETYKVGVFTDVAFMDGENEYIKPRQNRLTRRIIRDLKFRATSPKDTLEMWKYVYEGEREYIYPYINHADRIVGTTLLYEPCLYAEYLMEMAEKEQDLEIKEQLLELCNVYQVFTTPKQQFTLPDDSIIREFLG